MQELLPQALEALTVAVTDLVRGPLADAGEQIARLHGLQEDWDGDGAEQPPMEVVASTVVITLLFAKTARDAGLETPPQPWIAAAADGSIGLDWFYNERRLAVTCDSSGTLEWYAEATNVEQHGEGAGALQRLAKWLMLGDPLQDSA